MNYIKLFKSTKILIIALAFVGVYNVQALLSTEPSTLPSSNRSASLTEEAIIYAQEGGGNNRGEPENRVGGGTFAQEENRGEPENRVGGGSYFRPLAPPRQNLSGRRIFNPTRVRGLQPLTALVPIIRETSGDTPSQSVIGLTTQQNPTFWFYVPYKITANKKLEFVLEDEQGNQLYQTSLTPSASTPGVIGVQLSSQAAPLELDKLYRWHFKAYLNGNIPLAVNGWVQRVSPEESLKTELEQAKPWEKPAIYAAHGIWFDALTNLVQLRRNNPENIIFKAEWNRLLKDVDLETIAQEPVTNCCESTQ